LDPRIDHLARPEFADPEAGQIRFVEGQECLAIDFFFLESLNNFREHI
jgi:hypothetical protein